MLRLKFIRSAFFMSPASKYWHGCDLYCKVCSYLPGFTMKRNICCKGVILKLSPFFVNIYLDKNVDVR